MCALSLSSVYYKSLPLCSAGFCLLLARLLRFVTLEPEPRKEEGWAVWEALPLWEDRGTEEAWCWNFAFMFPPSPYLSLKCVTPVPDFGTIVTHFKEGQGGGGNQLNSNIIETQKHYSNTKCTCVSVPLFGVSNCSFIVLSHWLDNTVPAAHPSSLAPPSSSSHIVSKITTCTGTSMVDNIHYIDQSLWTPDHSTPTRVFPKLLPQTWQFLKKILWMFHSIGLQRISF